MRPVLRAWTSEKDDAKAMKLGDVHFIKKTNKDWVYVEDSWVPAECFDAEGFEEHNIVEPYHSQIDGYAKVDVGEKFIEIQRDGCYLYGACEKSLEVGWIPTYCINDWFMVRNRKRPDNKVLFAEFIAEHGIKNALLRFLDDCTQKCFADGDGLMKFLLHEFVNMNKLDADAENRIRFVTRKCAIKVMDHGFVVRAKNPSTLFFSNLE
jgi:hypothetical protein